ncbi:MAG: dihydroorotate dehydrogenase electron transfer subunit [Planctomycetota bacterium]|jgi:dihydroorotate dehydrogenase electron transfer subunit
MANEHSKSDKGVFDAVVSANKRIGQIFYRLGLEFSGAGAAAFAKSESGQFAELDLCGAALPRAEAIPEDLVDAAQRRILLRRPFSFCDVSEQKEKTRVDILYCVVGPASLRMTTLSTGDSVSVIGPLGRGFWVPEDKKTALLVAGGMGVGPLLLLAKVLTASWPKINVIAFAGAKTKTEMPFEKPLDEVSQQLGFSVAEFAEYGVNSMVATDDGSAGYHGLVTDCFSEWLGKESLTAEETIIYSCGPEKMLGRIAKIAEKKKFDCQISMERRMACGIGVCQSCAVECKVKGSNERVYKLCCKDGPVFDSRQIVFNV